MVYQILIHTPLWVFALLAYLVWQGIKAMQPRTVPIWRALIVPVVFIVWGISRIGFGHQDSPWPLAAWIVAALALLPLEDAWRPAVRANLEVSLRLARLVDEFALPDETEPAPVFTA